MSTARAAAAWLEAWLAAALLASGLAGCGQTAEMSIGLDLPGDPALSPDGDRLAELTLLSWSPDQPGQPAQSQTRPVTDSHQGLDLGTLTADQPVQVAIELRSGSERLLGYGETPEPVVPGASSDTRVSVHVRRPFAYVAGDPGHLASFDASLDPTGSYQGSVDVSAPLASTPTPDGAELVVVSDTGSGAQLTLVSTADHQIESGAAQVTLPGQVTDVAVTPDGGLAVVAHGGTGDAGGLSVIDLAAARDGQSQVAFAPVGAVGAVTIAPAPDGGPPRAIALLDRTTGFGCDATATPSSLAVVALSGDLMVQGSVDLGEPAADLSSAPDGSQVYVALPCSDELGGLALDPDGTPAGAVKALVSVPAASSVAVQRGQLWGAGVASPDAAGLRVVLVSASLAGANPTRVDLPPAQERIEFNELQDPGQVVEERVDADQLRAFQLVALPGSEMVALLTEGYYHGDESGDALGTPIVPEMEITTYEYLLVDPATRAAVQRLRTSCDGQVLSPDAVFTSFRCGQGPDQDVLDDDHSYIPVQVSAIYGGR